MQRLPLITLSVLTAMVLMPFSQAAHVSIQRQYAVRHSGAPFSRTVNGARFNNPARSEPWINNRAWSNPYYNHDWHRDWSHHHNYRWNNHGWVILDGGYWLSEPYYVYPYDSGYSVEMAVQAELMRLGYYDGPVDGDVGPATRSAITAFQRDHGLAITGRVNRSLMAALGI